jgi:ankyrin repeat protein
MPAVRPDPIDDRTPLMRAACTGDLCELFDLLLSGADVDAQDSDRWTALSYACWHREYEIAQQLLDSGADPDVHESYSMADTPLSLAAWRGDFDLVRLLIAHGADPTIYAGTSAVRAECHARRGGFHDISEFLLYHEDRHHRNRLKR